MVHHLAEVGTDKAFVGIILIPLRKAVRFMYSCVYQNKPMRWTRLEDACSYFYKETNRASGSEATQHYINVRLLMLKTGKEVVVR